MSIKGNAESFVEIRGSITSPDMIHGKDGKDAYEVAVDNGFEGTVEEWLASLHGAVSVASVTQTTETSGSGGENVVTVKLTNGSESTFSVYNGEDGETPVRGEHYWTEEDKEEIRAYVDEAILGGEW